MSSAGFLTASLTALRVCSPVEASLLFAMGGNILYNIRCGQVNKLSAMKRTSTLYGLL